MLTVAVIDDEWLSVECLVDMLKSCKHTMDTLSFTDAEFALKQLQHNIPDILFVDIKMPRMSGFDLIDQVIGDINPDVIPVIVSGYQDIQYYQCAIQREVIDYILKPIKINDLTATLDRAIERYQKIMCEKKHAACYIEHEKRKVFDQLAESGSVNMSLIDTSLRSDALSILHKLEHTRYQVVSAVADHAEARSRWDNVQETLAHRCRSIESFKKNVSQIDFVLFEPADFTNLNHEGFGDDLKQTRLRLGLSAAATCLSRFPQMASEARAACRFSLYSGLPINQYVDPQANTQAYSNSTQYEYQLSALKDACLVCSEKAEPLAARLFDVKPYQSYWDYRRNIEQVLLTFSLIIKNNHLAINPLELEKLLASSATRAELVQQVELWLTSIAQALEDSRRLDSKSNLLQTIRYIDCNYTLDISLDFLAAMAKVSRSYYCALFRQQCGESPVEYITRKRMQNACRLLEEGQMKISEAAMLCGYPDPYYFNKIFKKQMGQAPGEYMKQKHADKQV